MSALKRFIGEFPESVKVALIQAPTGFGKSRLVAEVMSSIQEVICIHAKSVRPDSRIDISGYFLRKIVECLDKRAIESSEFRTLREFSIYESSAARKVALVGTLAKSANYLIPGVSEFYETYRVFADSTNNQSLESAHSASDLDLYRRYLHHVLREKNLAIAIENAQSIDPFTLDILTDLSALSIRVTLILEFTDDDHGWSKESLLQAFRDACVQPYELQLEKLSSSEVKKLLCTISPNRLETFESSELSWQGNLRQIIDLAESRKLEIESNEQSARNYTLDRVLSLSPDETQILGLVAMHNDSVIRSELLAVINQEYFDQNKQGLILGIESLLNQRLIIEKPDFSIEIAHDSIIQILNTRRLIRYKAIAINAWKKHYLASYQKGLYLQHSKSELFRRVLIYALQDSDYSSILDISGEFAVELSHDPRPEGLLKSLEAARNQHKPNSALGMGNSAFNSLTKYLIFLKRTFRITVELEELINDIPTEDPDYSEVLTTFYIGCDKYVDTLAYIGTIEQSIADPKKRLILDLAKMISYHATGMNFERNELRAKYLESSNFSQIPEYGYILRFIAGVEDMELAIDQVSLALTLFENANYEIAAAMTEMQLGVLKCRTGNSVEGLANLHKAYANQSNLPCEKFSILNNLGAAYTVVESESFDACKVYLVDALSRANQHFDRAAVLNNLFICYCKEGSKEEAASVMKEILRMVDFRKIQAKSIIDYSLHNYKVGRDHFGIQDLDSRRIIPDLDFIGRKPEELFPVFLYHWYTDPKLEEAQHFG